MQKRGVFDTCAAILAGLVVIPGVFAFGLDVSAGPPLMFITLPEVFRQMPFGQVFAVVFFVAVLFAAVTSLMNLFETPIEALQEQFGLSRKMAVILVAFAAAAVGIFIESADMVSVWMDVVSIYIIPLGALLAAVMFSGSAQGICQRTGADRTQKTSWKMVRAGHKISLCGTDFVVYI